MEKDGYMTVEDAAVELGISVTSLYETMRWRDYPPYELEGKDIIIPLSEINEIKQYLARSKPKPGE